MKTKVITANDLINGDVIFLASDTQSWTQFLEEAWVSDCDEQTNKQLEAAQNCHMIIGAETAQIEYKEHDPVLTVFRDYIRSKGPSIRTDIGKQSIQQAA